MGTNWCYSQPQVVYKRWTSIAALKLYASVLARNALFLELGWLEASLPDTGNSMEMCPQNARMVKLKNKFLCNEYH